MWLVLLLGVAALVATAHRRWLAAVNAIQYVGRVRIQGALTSEAVEALHALQDYVGLHYPEHTGALYRRFWVVFVPHAGVDCVRTTKYWFGLVQYRCLILHTPFNTVSLFLLFASAHLPYVLAHNAYEDDPTVVLDSMTKYLRFRRG